MSDLNANNQFIMTCTVQEGNTSSISVSLDGIVGSNATNAKYYLACWQGTSAGSLKDAVAALPILYNSDQQWTEPFTGLNLETYNYTIALGIGWDDSWVPWSMTSTKTKTDIAAGCDMYYATTVVIQGTTPGVYPTSGNDAVEIILDDVYSKNILFNVSIPNNNRPDLFPQFVILKSGQMDNFPITTSNVLGQVQIPNAQAQNNMRLPYTLINGDNYTLVYLMGDVDGNGPNLNAVVGWETFTVNL